MYLGLTGYRLKGIDNLYAGILTDYCDINNLDKLEQELLSIKNPNENVSNIINKYSIKSNNEFSLNKDLDNISKYFTMDNSTDMITSLQNGAKNDDIFCQNTLKLLNKVSPTSIKVVHEALKNGLKLKTLKECLDMEYDIVSRFMSHNDFDEGIRAQLIDKDKNPKFKPSSLDDFNSIDISSFFPNI